MLPDFVVMGAQKSASTFLQACLAEHPEVYMPPGEVPAFESPDYEHGALAALERRLDEHAGRVIGIKRPNYLGSPEVAPRLTQHLPDARLLAVLRSPVERAVSAYFHNMSYGFIPVRPLHVGLRMLLDGEYDARFPRAREIIEFGFYHRHLTRYRHFLDRDAVLVMLHEDVRRDPAACVRRAYEFVGVEAGYAPRALHSRPQSVTYSLPRVRLAGLRNRLLYNYDALRTRLTPKHAWAPSRLPGGVVLALDRLVLACVLGNARPTLPPDLYHRLSALYEPDVQALQELLHRDLGAWLSKTPSAPGVSRAVRPAATPGGRGAAGAGGVAAAGAARVPGPRRGAMVLGGHIDALSPNEALATVHSWAQARESRYVCLANVHVVTTARLEPAFGRVLRGADLALPDGMPVAWALRRLGFRGQPRVDGPSLMWSCCELAARTGIAIYLYGSTPATLARLELRLLAAFPALRIAGKHAPPFRPLGAQEDATVVARINDSAAGLVFVALGCPRQEQWMAAHRGRIRGVMLGVGAAFDFHAGTLRRAPPWMQRAGLEWLYRLGSEPRRLWRRYLVTNTVFVWNMARELLHPRRFLRI